MADLSDLQAALTVKIAGADPSTGQEDNFMEVDSSGNAKTLVNNASGAFAVNIQDGGNSITVDGTVSVTQSGTWTIQQGTPPWSVVGNIASGSTDSGNPIKTGLIFNTTQPTVTNGQRIDSQATNRGAQIVATGIDVFNINNISGTISLPTGAATSANQATEITLLDLIDDVPTAQNGAFVKGNPAMGQLDDVSTTIATEDNVSAVRITTQRAFHINLRNNSGSEAGTSSTPIRIDPTGTTTQPVSGTITANQGTANTVSNSWPTKITDGTDTALVTTNGEQKVIDGLRNGGVYGNLVLTTANTTYQAKVGSNPLTNRKSLTIVALDDMYWGYDSSITTSTGTPLYKNQSIIFSIDPDSTFQVWLVANANSKNARVTESP